MRKFTGETDVLHHHRLPSEVRAYFSATAVRLREEVWLRLETRWVADGTPTKVTIVREEEGGGREVLKEIEGQLADGLWEEKWRVELPQSRLDELHGPIYFRFEAALDGHPGPARSQQLLLHRTRFSS